MTRAYHRKKQPELNRRAILDCAARLAVEKGIAAVTVQAVAEAAGVTKGGLFHHFPSKQALVEGVFSDLMEQWDAELDGLMAKDADPHGRFTRAYVNSVYESQVSGIDSPWAALWVSMIAESGLRELWSKWLEERLERHRETDDTPVLELVRLAADGAWFAILMGQGPMVTGARNVQARLLAMTRSAEKQVNPRL
ncbi:MAG: TetR/AcrR family transcriptional regulator [Cystobacter sp.]